MHWHSSLSTMLSFVGQPIFCFIGRFTFFFCRYTCIGTYLLGDLFRFFSFVLSKSSNYFRLGIIPMAIFVPGVPWVKLFLTPVVPGVKFQLEFNFNYRKVQQIHRKTNNSCTLILQNLNFLLSYMYRRLLSLVIRHLRWCGFLQYRRASSCGHNPTEWMYVNCIIRYRWAIRIGQVFDILGLFWDYTW